MIDALVGSLPVLLLGVGLILIVMEAFTPGAHLIVIGVALAGAGFIGYIYPPAADILVLALLTLAIGTGAAWVYRDLDIYEGTGSDQTSDSDSLSGTRGYVLKRVTERTGEVKIENGGFDPTYSARSTGETIEEGEDIVVIDPGGGNVLTVRSIEEESDPDDSPA